MLTNPIELKTLIDTKITNETVDYSITPAEVGGIMKDIVNYTTEVKEYVEENLGPSAYKVRKTSITSAQLLSILTNPIVLVPGIEGKIIQPLNIVFKYNHNSIPYSAGNWRLFINNNLFTIPSYLNVAFSTIQSQLVINTFNEEPNNIIGNSLKLNMNANPTNGNGTVDVYTTYIEITV
jgi:hypothetical protein